jgi:hypothetical protein
VREACNREPGAGRNFALQRLEPIVRGAMLRILRPPLGDEDEGMLIDMRYESPEQAAAADLPVICANPPLGTIIL